MTLKTIPPFGAAMALVVATVLAPLPASAEVSGNIGLTSNYIWRGTTQTAGDAAIQGGLDYAHEAGLYAGLWTSNTSFGSPELDLYAGFGGEIGAIGYDVSVIDYVYPQADDLDWLELNGSLSYRMFSASLGVTDDVFGTDTDATYFAVGADIPVKDDVTVNLHIGTYDFDKPGTAGFDDYVDYSIGVSKGDFNVMLTDTDLDPDKACDGSAGGTCVDGDPTVVVTWSKSFDL